MKALCEAIALIVLCVFWLGVWFIFDGNPDIWDKWHDRAMQECIANQTTEVQK